MDLNSYLTDFFKLLQNNTNNLFGGNMYGGGVLPPWIVANKPSNDQIIEKYFNIPPGSTDVTVDTGLTIKPQFKDEVVPNQVEIVQYMLTNPNNGNFKRKFKGGSSRKIYGGNVEITSDVTPQKAAAAAASALLGTASAASPSAVDSATSSTGLVDPSVALSATSANTSSAASEDFTDKMIKFLQGAAEKPETKTENVTELLTLDTKRLIPYHNSIQTDMSIDEFISDLFILEGKLTDVSQQIDVDTKIGDLFILQGKFKSV